MKKEGIPGWNVSHHQLTEPKQTMLACCKCFSKLTLNQQFQHNTHTRNSLGFCSGGTGWRHFGPPVGLLFVRYILRASSGSVRINKRGDESQVFESRPRCLVPHTRAHALVCLERWWRTAKQVCGKRRQRTRPGMTTKRIKYKEKDQLPL